MKNIKFNFGLLKDLNVCFLTDFKVTVGGKLKKVKRRKTSYIFYFDSDISLEVPIQTLLRCSVKYENDVFWFVPKTNDWISGYFLFSMFDTYGFPVELTIEELESKGYICDKDGFYEVQKVQKMKTQNTFKNKNAFN